MAVQEMLTGYRSTPHPATNVAPYEALMKRPVRTKLDYCNTRVTSKDQTMEENDKQYKQGIAAQAENRNTKKHTFQVEDFVFTPAD